MLWSMLIDAYPRIIHGQYIVLANAGVLLFAVIDASIFAHHSSEMRSLVNQWYQWPSLRLSRHFDHCWLMMISAWLIHAISILILVPDNGGYPAVWYAPVASSTTCYSFIYIHLQQLSTAGSSYSYLPACLIHASNDVKQHQFPTVSSPR